MSESSLPSAPAPPRDATAPQQDAAAQSRSAAALVGLALAANQTEIVAAAATEATPPARPQGRVRRPLPRARRQAAGASSDVPFSPDPTSVPVEPQQPGTLPPSAAAEEVDTQSELRNWVKDNATLLSNASLLISISALALNLLPETGVLDPYIKALIFGAALLLLAEMHHQWPDDLQLHMFRPMALPQNHSWRMVGFAFIMQVATLVFAVWATLTTPLILVPLTALGVVVLFRQWYFRRFRGLAARSFGILALVLTLVLSEVLMLVVWAVLTDEQLTIQLWEDERPGLTIEIGPEQP